MDEIFKQIGSLLGIAPRTGFALAAAGIFVALLLLLVGLPFGLPAILAFIPAFGFFVWAYHVVRSTALSIITNRARRAKQTADVIAARDKLERDTKAGLENLDQMKPDESRALLWMYHKGKRRIRAEYSVDALRELAAMHVLVAEDIHKFGDRFYEMPQHIYEEIERTVGEPKPESKAEEPPWERSGRMRI